jgi:hypothetical protein
MIGTSVSTSASVPGVGLVVAGFAAGLFLLMELNFRRWGGGQPPPPRTTDASYRASLARANYISNNGGWIKYWRIGMLSVAGVALLVALVGFVVDSH